MWSQGQRLTLLFVSSSFVFISHLTNFLSYSVFMFVAYVCFCVTLPLRKNLLGSKRKAINIYFAEIKLNRENRFSYQKFHLLLTFLSNSPCEMFSANMNAVTKWWTAPASPQWGLNTNVLKPRSLKKKKAQQNNQFSWRSFVRHSWWKWHLIVCARTIGTDGSVHKPVWANEWQVPIAHVRGTPVRSYSTIYCP